MIEFEQIEKHIYVYRWLDQVDMKDAQDSFEVLQTVNNGQPYVAIVDMHKIKRIPRDIAAMRHLIKSEVAEGLRGYVIYGASSAIESFIKPMSLLAPTTYKFAQDWETALQTARILLQSD